MKKILLGLLLVLGFAAIGLYWATRWPEPPAHQVFINANVVTMNQQIQLAEAVSVRGKMIEVVGTNEQVKSLISSTTVVHDLTGKTLLPGFVDAHSHFPFSALSILSADLTSPPVGNVTNLKQLFERLRGQLANTPEDRWIFGIGYDNTLLAENRHPTRAELDAISSERPIAAIHVSGHMAVVNSRALGIIGINADSEDPEGGVIVRRDGSREPNGLLQESARNSVLEILQDIDLSTTYRMMAHASTEYAAAGVTTVQSGGVSPALAQGLSLFSKLSVIPQRIVIFPMEHDFGAALTTGEFDAEDYRTDRLTVGPVKIVADGSIQGYTGYLSQPYHTPHHGDAQYRGYAAVSREELFSKVAALQKAGYQLAIHGNGDESIEDILDAIEASHTVKPQADPRTILIHAQMARHDQIKRMRALGVTPSFYSAHTWYWGDGHRDKYIGPERGAAISPAAWAIQEDVRFSSHLDTPVTPMQPLQAVWSMVNRITYAGKVLGPEQRISPMQALRAVTIDAAWQVFEDDNRGSIEVGKLADLVVLSGNPLIKPLQIRDLKVEKTLLGGQQIFPPLD